jgi:SsrA-binding protein
MAKSSGKPEADSGRPHSPVIRNRKAFHEYHITEQVEAGLALVGTEVKSLRDAKCQLNDAYVRLRGREAWLVGVNIAIYPQAVGVLQHDPLRDRKCLLHKRQIEELVRLTAQKGFTIVPLAIYFKNGYAKVELGVGTGKRDFDKRQDLKKREADRDIKRALNRRR